MQRYGKKTFPPNFQGTFLRHKRKFSVYLTAQPLPYTLFIYRGQLGCCSEQQGLLPGARGGVARSKRQRCSEQEAVLLGATGATAWSKRRCCSEQEAVLLGARGGVARSKRRCCSEQEAVLLGASVLSGRKNKERMNTRYCCACQRRPRKEEGMAVTMAAQ